MENIGNLALAFHHEGRSDERLEVALVLLGMPEEVVTIEFHSLWHGSNQLIDSSEVDGSAITKHRIALHSIARSEHLVVGIGKVAFAILIAHV